MDGKWFTSPIMPLYSIFIFPKIVVADDDALFPNPLLKDAR